MDEQIVDRISNIEERVDGIERRNIIAFLLIALLLLTFSITGIINVIRSATYSEPERQIIYMTDPDEVDSSS